MLGAFVPVGVRLARSDVVILKELAEKLRASQAGVLAIALRHLNETMRLGQPVFVSPATCTLHIGFKDGTSLPPLVGDDLSVDGSQLVVWQGRAHDSQARRVAAVNAAPVSGITIAGPWQGIDPFTLPGGIPVQMVPYANLPTAQLGQSINSLSQAPVGFPTR